MPRPTVVQSIAVGSRSARRICINMCDKARSTAPQIAPTPIQPNWDDFLALSSKQTRDTTNAQVIPIGIKRKSPPKNTNNDPALELRYRVGANPAKTPASKFLRPRREMSDI